VRYLILNTGDADDTAVHVRGLGGDPVLWRGLLPDGDPPRWARPTLANPAKRWAIIRSYQALLDSGKADDAIVMQEDIRFDEPPTVNRHHLTVWPDRWRGARHICPHAFYLPAALRPQLRNLWADERRPVCESWWPLTRHATIHSGKVTQWR
jgi:hypothetical protein